MKLRPRCGNTNFEDRHELDALLGDGASPELDVQLFRRRVEADLEVPEVREETPPAYLTAGLLQLSGFRSVVVVRGSRGGRSADGARQVLGLSLPLQQVATPERLAAAVGRDHQVPTIDVQTQEPGPRMSLGQLAEYFAQPPDERDRLINVVSCSLAGTALEGRVVVPAPVRSLDLAASVWPSEEEPRPETLLYMLMGPQGAYTDWHVDMGGSAVWYHVLSGRKVFLVAPSTPQNLVAFEAWSGSRKQRSEWLGESLEGVRRVQLAAGDTVFLPSGWPHAVSTPEDAVVVGGNFLHSLDWAVVADVHRREQRLGITPKFQYPLFRPLLWYAARSALGRLQHLLTPGRAGALSRWELQGLPALLSLLREWLGAGGGGARPRGKVPASAGVPEGHIPDPFELLADLERHLAAALIQHGQLERHAERARQAQQAGPEPAQQRLAPVPMLQHADTTGGLRMAAACLARQEQEQAQESKQGASAGPVVAAACGATRAPVQPAPRGLAGGGLPRRGITGSERELIKVEEAPMSATVAEGGAVPAAAAAIPAQPPSDGQASVVGAVPAPSASPEANLNAPAAAVSLEPAAGAVLTPPASTEADLDAPAATAGQVAAAGAAPTPSASTEAVPDAPAATAGLVAAARAVPTPVDNAGGAGGGELERVTEVPASALAAPTQPARPAQHAVLRGGEEEPWLAGGGPLQGSPGPASHDPLRDAELAAYGTGFEAFAASEPSFLDSMSLMFLEGAGASLAPAPHDMRAVRTMRDEAAAYALQAVLGPDATVAAASPPASQPGGMTQQASAAFTGSVARLQGPPGLGGSASPQALVSPTAVSAPLVMIPVPAPEPEGVGRAGMGIAGAGAEQQASEPKRWASHRTKRFDPRQAALAKLQRLRSGASNSGHMLHNQDGSGHSDPAAGACDLAIIESSDEDGSTAAAAAGKPGAKRSLGRKTAKLARRPPGPSETSNSDISLGAGHARPAAKLQQLKAPRGPSGSEMEPDSSASGDESADESADDLEWEPGMPRGKAVGRQRRSQEEGGGASRGRKRLRKGAGADGSHEGAAVGRAPKRAGPGGRAADDSVKGGRSQKASGSGGVGRPEPAQPGKKAAPKSAWGSAAQPGRGAMSGPAAPLPPKNLQALGRKNPIGYVPSLGRSRQAAAGSAAAAAAAGVGRSQVRGSVGQTAGGSLPARPSQPNGAAAGSAGTHHPASAQQAQRSIAEATAAEPAEQVGAVPAEPAVQYDRKQREAAEKLLGAVARLEQALKKERWMLDGVTAGVVPVRDGGAQLRASIAQKERELHVKLAVAEGRVFSYVDEKGVSQGPFTAAQLRSLLRAGVLSESTQVRHPRHISMALQEALALQEPLSAVLLRQRAERAKQAPQGRPRHAQQAGQAAGAGAVTREAGGPAVAATERPLASKPPSRDPRRQQSTQQQQQQQEQQTKEVDMGHQAPGQGSAALAPGTRGHRPGDRGSSRERDGWEGSSSGHGPGDHGRQRGSGGRRPEGRGRGSRSGREARDGPGAGRGRERDRDSHNPKGNRKSAGFTQEERDSFAANLLSQGFVDAFRHQYPDVVGYTYWGYRFNLRAKNAGWRLDYALVSDSLLPRVHECYHAYDVLGSDHCPVVLVLRA